LPGAHHVETDVQTIRFTDEDGRRWCWPTPWQVSQYVVDFDAGEPLEPFRFVLDPSRAIELKRRVRTSAEKRDAAAKARSSRAEAKGGKPKRETRQVGQGRPKKAARVHATVMRGGDGARTKAPPRVYKTTKRNYGHRVLRINKARADAA